MSRVGTSHQAWAGYVARMDESEIAQESLHRGVRSLE